MFHDAFLTLRIVPEMPPAANRFGRILGVHRSNPRDFRRPQRRWPGLRGGGGPTVKSTDPDSATVDTMLNVRVLGSGYDQGSRANWAFKGIVSDKIVTNSTQFVSSTELIANITISARRELGKARRNC